MSPGAGALASATRRARGAVAPFSGMTALVDTLFLLLFALLALSDARTSQPAELVHVELPGVEPAPAAPADAPSRAMLEVDRDGRLRLLDPARELPDRAALDAALDGLRGSALPEELVVDVHADRAVPHGTVLELLQHLRLRGYVSVRMVALGDAALEGPFGGPR